MTEPTGIPEWAKDLTPADFKAEGPDGHEVPLTVTHNVRKAITVATSPRDDYDFEAQIIGMRNEITDLVRTAESLRWEAEQLVCWRNGMGEGTGSLQWTEARRMYAANMHNKNCIAAAELKSRVQQRLPNGTEKFFDKLFSLPSRFGVTVTQQARKELGL